MPAPCRRKTAPRAQEERKTFDPQLHEPFAHAPPLVVAEDQPELSGRQRRNRVNLVANNVIGLIQDPHHVCSVAARAIENVVLRGVACRGANHVGRVHLDPRGRPTAASTLLIDRGSWGFGTRRDIDGRPRDLRPDIGAYEYRGVKPRS